MHHTLTCHRNARRTLTDGALAKEHELELARLLHAAAAATTTVTLSRRIVGGHLQARMRALASGYGARVPRRVRAASKRAEQSKRRADR